MKSSHGNSRHRVGDTVAVDCDPGDPAAAEIAGAGQRSVVPIAVAGVIVPVFGLMLMTSAFR